MKIYLAYILTIALSAFLKADRPYKWQKISEKDDIIIYTRDGRKSNFKELKVVTWLDADFSTIANALNDVEAYTDWIYNCETSKLLDRNGNIDYYYVKTKVPWPVWDRDMVMKSKLTIKRKKVMISHSFAVDTIMPHKTDVVRITQSEIKWTFRKMKEKIKLTYYLKGNPGGSIPAWLSNMFVEVGPYNSIQGFKKIIKQEKYQKPIDFSVFKK